MKTQLYIVKGGSYSGQGDYGFRYVKVDVVKETEKAVQVKRFVDSKEKEYTCWFPKSALDLDIEEETADLKPWFRKRMESYTEWFISAN
jgi:hypothetical protein